MSKTKFEDGDNVNNYEILAVDGVISSGAKRYIVRHACGQYLSRTVNTIDHSHRGCSKQFTSEDLSLFDKLKMRFAR